MAQQAPARADQGYQVQESETYLGCAFWLVCSNNAPQDCTDSEPGPAVTLLYCPYVVGAFSGKGGGMVLHCHCMSELMLLYVRRFHSGRLLTSCHIVWKCRACREGVVVGVQELCTSLLSAAPEACNGCREKFWKAVPPKEARRAALWMDDAATRDANADAPPVPLVAINHCALGVSDLDNMAKYAAPSHLVLLLVIHAVLLLLVLLVMHDSQRNISR